MRRKRTLSMAELYSENERLRKWVSVLRRKLARSEALSEKYVNEATAKVWFAQDHDALLKAYAELEAQHNRCVKHTIECTKLEPPDDEYAAWLEAPDR
jgi:hypothetical protein